MPTTVFLTDDLRSRLSDHAIRRDYRRLYNGAWVLRGSEPDLATRSRALAALYPDGVLLGPSSAAIRGVRLDPGFAPEISVGRKRVHRAGVVFRRVEPPRGHVLVKGGVRVTSVQVTAMDLARFHPRETAVLAIERLIQQAGVPARYWTTPSLLCDDVPPCWADSKARRVLAEVEPRSESPKETLTRLALTGAGIDGFDVQVRVVVEGAEYRIDLAHARAKVGVEYDGGHHRDARQQARDLERRNRLQDAGWTMIYVTSSMLYGGRDEMLAHVRSALRERGF